MEKLNNEKAKAKAMIAKVKAKAKVDIAKERAKAKTQKQKIIEKEREKVKAKNEKAKERKHKGNVTTNDMLENLYAKPKKDRGVNMPTFQQYEPGFIYQADLLFLPMDNGKKYALVVVDIGSRLVDAVPLQFKDSASVTKGLKTIFERKILGGIPNILEVDDGTEFKAEAKKYLKDNNITVRVGKTNRHRQQAVVERKNQQIGTLLFKRMTAEELQTKKPSYKWIDDLPAVIAQINKKIKPRKPINPDKDQNFICAGDACDALEQGTAVRVALDFPRDVATGKRLHGKFRDSDIRWEIKSRTIMSTIIQPGQPPMYLVSDDNGETDHSAAYTKNQLQVVPVNEKAPDPAMIRKGTKTKTVIQPRRSSRLKNKN